MRQVFLPTHGWGPSGQRAALSITFDNLGEAAEIEMGMWGDQPVGSHHTAAFVPHLIKALGDVRATYFIEVSNTAIYPAAIRACNQAGHEIGIHAWRHELWDQCAPRRVAFHAAAPRRPSGSIYTRGMASSIGPDRRVGHG